MTEICLGRQPIYDRDLRVLGYRIAPQHSDGQITSLSPREMAEKLNAHGLEKVIGIGKAFVQVSGEALAQVTEFLPKERFVLEIASPVVQESDARAALLELANSGYDIALHNCIQEGGLDELFVKVRFVIFDASADDRSTLTQQIARHTGKDRKLLVNNVDTHLAYRDLCELGFDYFQGQFVSLPDLEHGGELKASRLGSMRLLSKLQDPNLELSDLEGIIEADVSLSFKLLRYLNSAFFALPTKVESIKRALLLLGLRPVRNWASMIVLSGFDDKPQQLILTAMLRAKFCELLARSHGYKNADMFFTVGLLSTLDAFLNKSMADCLQLVPLSDDVKNAILEHTGDAGAVLDAVLSYEIGKVKKLNAPQGVTTSSMADTFLESVSWVTECSAEIIVGNMSRRAA